MLQSFTNTRGAFRCSLAVLSNDRRLLLIPALSCVCALLVFCFFITPLALPSSGHAFTSQAHWDVVESRVWSQGDNQGHRHNGAFTGKAEFLLAMDYMVTLVVTSFFSVAFVRQVMSAFRCEPVPIGSALRFALGKWRAILLWSMFAGLVGLLLQQLEERMSWVGKWVIRIINIAWSVAAVFVIPVLVVGDEINPLRNLRSSANVIRKTWGELVIGFVGLEAGMYILVFAVMLSACTLGAMGVMMGAIPSIFWMAAVLVFFLVAAGYVSAVISDIYECALYVYATTGQMPPAFDLDSADSAWKRKKVEG